MDLTKTSASSHFKKTGDFESRVASVEYYLLAEGRDEDRAFPVRVSRNRAGHTIAVEFTDETGESYISNDKGFDVRNENGWLRRTDRAGYEAALQKIRDEAGSKVVALKPRPI